MFLHQKYLFFVEILIADHSLLEEIVLNEVSLGEAAQLLLPWCWVSHSKVAKNIHNQKWIKTKKVQQ